MRIAPFVALLARPRTLGPQPADISGGSKMIAGAKWL